MTANVASEGAFSRRGRKRESRPLSNGSRLDRVMRKRRPLIARPHPVLAVGNGRCGDSRAQSPMRALGRRLRRYFVGHPKRASTSIGGSNHAQPSCFLVCLLLERHLHRSTTATTLQKIASPRLRADSERRLLYDEGVRLQTEPTTSYDQRNSESRGTGFFATKALVGRPTTATAAFEAVDVDWRRRVCQATSLSS